MICAFYAQADPSHLDIRQPSLVAARLQGPVKKITTEYSYQMSDRKYREEAEYDTSGNLLYRKKWDYKDNLTLFVTNSYNEAGCLTRQIVDDVKKKEKFDYDIVLSPETRQLAYKCKLTGEIEVVTYNDDKFRLNATIKRKGKKNVPLSTYARDANNQIKSYTRYDDDGRIDYTTYSKYDDQGRLKKSVIVYKQEKKKTENTYEYLSSDDHKNWTQRLLKIMVTEEDETKNYDKFTSRTIEYYEMPEATE